MGLLEGIPAGCRVTRLESPARPITAKKLKGREEGEQGVDCRELRIPWALCDRLTPNIGLWPLERPSGGLTLCSSSGRGCLRVPAQVASWGETTTVERNFREDCGHLPICLVEPGSASLQTSPPEYCRALHLVS